MHIDGLSGGVCTLDKPFECPVEATLRFLRALWVAAMAANLGALIGKVLWIGPSILFASLPNPIRKPIENALQESLLSGLSTGIIIGAVFTMASSAASWFVANLLSSRPVGS